MNLTAIKNLVPDKTLMKTASLLVACYCERTTEMGSTEEPGVAWSSGPCTF